MSYRPVRSAAERKEKKSGAAAPAPTSKENGRGPVVPPSAFGASQDQLDDEMAEPRPPRVAVTWPGLLPREDREFFCEFSDDIFDHYMPHDKQESQLVGKLVETRWVLGRRKGAYCALERALYEAQPDAAKWSDADWHRLSVASNICAQAEQAVTDAYARVDQMLQRRIEDGEFAMKREFANHHLELDLKKFKFELWKAGLATFTPKEDDAAEKPGAKKPKAN